MLLNLETRNTSTRRSRTSSYMSITIMCELVYQQYLQRGIAESSLVATVWMMHSSNRRTLTAGNWKHIEETNHQLYLQRCIALNYPYELKSTLGTAAHVQCFQKKLPTWTYTTKNSAHLLQTGEVYPDQDTVFLLSTPPCDGGLFTPRSYSADESLAKA